MARTPAASRVPSPADPGIAPHITISVSRETAGHRFLAMFARLEAGSSERSRYADIAYAAGIAVRSATLIVRPAAWPSTGRARAASGSGMRPA